MTNIHELHAHFSTVIILLPDCDNSTVKPLFYFSFVMPLKSFVYIAKSKENPCTQNLKINLFAGTRQIGKIVSAAKLSARKDGQIVR
jgi:hypothetical protein